ncbi:MAG: hypothetical protein ABI680_00655 [Chthoniobacteraceae bacterium]
MGQQSNKVQKRRRRINYIKRKKEARIAAATSARPRVRKSPAKKKEAAPAPAAVEAAPATAE